MIRVNQGSFKGKSLCVPNCGTELRPTKSRLRDAVFNTLLSKYSVYVIDANVIDLFCGAGTLGFNALSLGARQVWFIDHSRKAEHCIKDNIKRLGVETRAHFTLSDLYKPQRLSIPFTGRASLVLCDAPYSFKDYEFLLTFKRRISCLEEHSLWIIEVSTQTLDRIRFPDECHVLERRRHGRTTFLFVRLSS